jgi:magnesium transporter
MTTSPTDESLVLLEQIAALISVGDVSSLEEMLQELHPSDIADVLESLGDELRLMLVRALPTDLASETLAEMEEGEVRAELLTALAPAEGAQLLHELSDDDATDLVGELLPEARDRLLAELPTDEAGEIRDLLQYDQESAGGIMTTALVSVLGHVTAREAIEAVRVQGREVEDFYTVFVVDEETKLLGTVPLDDLILSDTDRRIDELVEPTVASGRSEPHDRPLQRGVPPGRFGRWGLARPCHLRRRHRRHRGGEHRRPPPLFWGVGR